MSQAHTCHRLMGRPSSQAAIEPEADERLLAGSYSDPVRLCAVGHEATSLRAQCARESHALVCNGRSALTLADHLTEYMLYIQSAGMLTTALDGPACQPELGGLSLVPTKLGTVMCARATYAQAWDVLVLSIDSYARRPSLSQKGG
jgi:hypothetical protein